MNLSVTNENYAAIVFRLQETHQLEGLDNLRGLPIAGHQSLVSKDMQQGTMCIGFLAETQLSERFCFHNNLFSNSAMNGDPEVNGYLGKNRRVKAIKLRGNVSNALVVPVESLEALIGEAFKDLKEGDSFTDIDGVEICKKYVVQHRKPVHTQRQKKKTKADLVKDCLFPKHFDTSSVYRDNKFFDAQHVYITQKLHGTSVRLGHQVVNDEPGFFVGVFSKLFPNLKKLNKNYHYIAGSRNVVKSAINSSTGFYETDVWTENLKKISDLIPKNYILYGEIVGFSGVATHIQKNYTYDCVPGQNKLYIYRVAIINEDGVEQELDWKSVKAFCERSGLLHVPELYDGLFGDISLDIFKDRVYSDSWPEAVTLSEKGTVDEGVCIRSDHPFIVQKAKSPAFLEYETKQLDAMEKDSANEEQFEEVV